LSASLVNVDTVSIVQGDDIDWRSEASRGVQNGRAAYIVTSKSLFVLYTTISKSNAQGRGHKLWNSLFAFLLIVENKLIESRPNSRRENPAFKNTWSVKVPLPFNNKRTSRARIESFEDQSGSGSPNEPSLTSLCVQAVFQATLHPAYY
jgi:hypothetical protein